MTGSLTSKTTNRSQYTIYYYLSNELIVDNLSSPSPVSTSPSHETIINNTPRTNQCQTNRECKSTGKYSKIAMDNGEYQYLYYNTCSYYHPSANQQNININSNKCNNNYTYYHYNSSLQSSSNSNSYSTNGNYYQNRDIDTSSISKIAGDVNDNYHNRKISKIAPDC